MFRLVTAILLSPVVLPFAAEGADVLEPSKAQRPLFDLLQVEEAWALAGEDEGCSIGVLDTGFDFFHPALVDVLRPGFFADGVFHSPQPTVTGHGTSMASLIVAQRVAEDGMVGLAPRCPAIGASMGMRRHDLLTLQRRFVAEHPDAGPADWQAEMARHADELQAFGRNWIDAISRTAAEGIHSLVDSGARVISFSAFVGKRVLSQYPDFDARLDEAFAYAAAHDVLLVIGAGNTGTFEEAYPGSETQVLVVGATLLDDTLWALEVDAGGGQKIRQGSCTGPRVSVVAPMQDLRNAMPSDPALYRVKDGPTGPESMPFDGEYTTSPYGATSMATAITASLAALVRSARPDLRVEEVVAVIQESAVDLGAPGRDDEFGHGRIDYRAALELALDREAGR